MATKRNSVEIEVEVVGDLAGMRRLESKLKSIGKSAQPLERSLDGASDNLKKAVGQVGRLDKKLDKLDANRLNKSLSRTKERMQAINRSASRIGKSLNVSLGGLGGKVNNALGGIPTTAATNVGSRLGNAMGVGLAAGLGAIISGTVIGKIREIGTEIDAVSKLADRLNLETETLRKTQFIGNLQGVENTQIEGAASDFQRKFSQFKGGNKKVFEGLPQSVIKALEATQSGNDAWAIALDYLQSIKDDTKRVDAGRILSGEEGSLTLSRLADLTAEQLARISADYEKLAGNLDGSLETIAAKFQDSTTRMETSADGLKGAIFKAIGPDLTKRQNEIADKLAENRDQIAEKVEKFATRIDSALGAVDWDAAADGAFALAGGLVDVTTSIAAALEAIGKPKKAIKKVVDGMISAPGNIIESASADLLNVVTRLRDGEGLIDSVLSFRNKTASELEERLRQQDRGNEKRFGSGEGKDLEVSTNRLADVVSQLGASIRASVEQITGTKPAAQPKKPSTGKPSSGQPARTPMGSTGIEAPTGRLESAMQRLNDTTGDIDAAIGEMNATAQKNRTIVDQATSLLGSAGTDLQTDASQAATTVAGAGSALTTSSITAKTNIETGGSNAGASISEQTAAAFSTGASMVANAIREALATPINVNVNAPASDGSLRARPNQKPLFQLPSTGPDNP